MVAFLSIKQSQELQTVEQKVVVEETELMVAAVWLAE